ACADLNEVIEDPEPTRRNAGGVAAGRGLLDGGFQFIQPYRRGGHRFTRRSEGPVELLQIGLHLLGAAPGLDLAREHEVLGGVSPVELLYRGEAVIRVRLQE